MLDHARMPTVTFRRPSRVRFMYQKVSSYLRKLPGIWLFSLVFYDTGLTDLQLAGIMISSASRLLSRTSLFQSLKSGQLSQIAPHQAVCSSIPPPSFPSAIVSNIETTGRDAIPHGLGQLNSAVAVISKRTPQVSRTCFGLVRLF